MPHVFIWKGVKVVVEGTARLLGVLSVPYEYGGLGVLHLSYFWLDAWIAIAPTLWSHDWA